MLAFRQLNYNARKLTFGLVILFHKLDVTMHFDNLVFLREPRPLVVFKLVAKSRSCSFVVFKYKPGALDIVNTTFYQFKP